MTCSVELGHVYRQELETHGYEAWADRLVEEYAAVPCGENYGALLVFVDDYPDEYDARERADVAGRLLRHAKRHGIELDAVAFESSCAAVARDLGEMLPHSEWWLTRNGNTQRTAVLIREAEGYWTCPALACVWTLARLGVEPYRQAVLKDAVVFTDTYSADELFSADEVMTVLPVQYLGNESAVLDMLRSLRTPRIPLNRVRYVFT